ncbi:hypothetical protein AB0M91_23935 [Micromonospora rifamycinica]|uniref:hypothetical protein n=1 Tax=Micromonospora rifamycinica TaxID=291594 RepID=UPI003426D53F
MAEADDVRELAEELTSLSIAPKVLLLPDVGHYVASSRRAGTALEAELAHYRSVVAGAGNDQQGLHGGQR